jgi:hypothetical protein
MMPHRGQPPDDPSSAPESGTVREFVEDDFDSPATPRGPAEKATDPNLPPAGRSHKADTSSASEER